MKKLYTSGVEQHYVSNFWLYTLTTHTSYTHVIVQFLIDYRSANIDNEAKTKKASAKKRYVQLLKDKSPKLYDKPPHLR